MSIAPVMEALALYDFIATQADELSFKQGDIIKVLDMKTDQNWYTAERKGEEGLVPKPYIELKPHDWWHGRTSRADAEKILKAEGHDGSFLVRDSEANPGDFSVSVKFGEAVQHYKVLRDGEGKYFLWVMKFKSLNSLIEYHKNQTISKTQHIVLKDFQRKKPSIPPAKEEYCQALYDFHPQNSDEILLTVGKRIKIINKDDANWWEGECDGERGMFPATYVKELHGE